MDFDEVLVRIKAVNVDVKVQEEVDPCNPTYPTHKLARTLARAIHGADPARPSHLLAMVVDNLIEHGAFGEPVGICDEEEGRFLSAAQALCEAWEKHDKTYGIGECDR
jgi:hypothetical protein